MHKSVKLQLLEFLQENGGIFHNGELQRMVNWRNKNGTIPTPRTLVRRLQELVIEEKIHVNYKNGQAYFSAKPIILKRQVVKELPNGKVEISYI